jgi:hypothetical protein
MLHSNLNRSDHSEDNIRMDRREIRRECVDWMLLVQDRDQWRAVVNTVMKLLVP